MGSDQAPSRAAQDVAPKTRRFVWRRDGGKCCVPTCRASCNIDVHHIVPRAAGGSHDAENTTLLCGGHHRALHNGKLTITGKAPALEVRWLHAEPATHVGSDTRDPEPPARATPPPTTHVG